MTKPQAGYSAEQKLQRHAAQLARRNIKMAELIELVNNLKIQRGCADCGYNSHPVALDFDHLPEFEKVMNIARMIRRNFMTFARLMEEIDKCEVVCSNCHRIRTHTRRLAERA